MVGGEQNPKHEAIWQAMCDAGISPDEFSGYLVALDAAEAEDEEGEEGEEGENGGIRLTLKNAVEMAWDTANDEVREAVGFLQKAGCDLEEEAEDGFQG